MLKIKNKKIYTENNIFLKHIKCPKNVSLVDLKDEGNNTFFCDNCNKNVLDTNNISENELIKLLKKNKDICLKISKFNPMFRFL